MNRIPDVCYQARHTLERIEEWARRGGASIVGGSTHAAAAVSAAAAAAASASCQSEAKLESQQLAIAHAFIAELDQCMISLNLALSVVNAAAVMQRRPAAAPIAAAPPAVSAAAYLRASSRISGLRGQSGDISFSTGALYECNVSDAGSSAWQIRFVLFERRLSCSIRDRGFLNNFCFYFLSSDRRRALSRFILILCAPCTSCTSTISQTLVLRLLRARLRQACRPPVRPRRHQSRITSPLSSCCPPATRRAHLPRARSCRPNHCRFPRRHGPDCSRSETHPRRLFVLLSPPQSPRPRPPHCGPRHLRRHPRRRRSMPTRQTARITTSHSSSSRRCVCSCPALPRSSCPPARRCSPVCSTCASCGRSSWPRGPCVDLHSCSPIRAPRRRR
jgi:hypothetical protein